MTLFRTLDETSPGDGRIALGIEYHGGNYFGWQRLSHGPSVQGRLEQALSRVAAGPVRVLCSGRTDSGVHASRQIVHFEAPAARSEKAWVMGTNANLPDDISVRWARRMPDDFHARFSARARRYRYLIANQAVPPALDSTRVYWHRWPLDVESMHQAAQVLPGEHDFSGYRAAGCQSRTPWRHVHFVEVRRFGPVVVVDIQANAFLLHMVRNIVGVLLSIGDGRQPIAWARQVLEEGDRTRSAATAPPHGLHFVDVRYPDYELPEEPLGPMLLYHTGEWTGDRPLPEDAWHRRSTPPLQSAETLDVE
ncbi:tRNA pseudouridine(38-40) synthase [Kushneria sinocarnis]|uniref:tRNA pseudouridine synthase A n=1 Tax=Kushneria sinocarnis TaxID=595502 RepID=A0A420WUX6_9GAMM|nr:tRNA pseudouridine(38-40) synthase TruA [Kushneria sinocarnis]RKQ97234.1 tRNA pseudouridine(38-40) synthase [Kushneria sinocarnis]